MISLFQVSTRAPLFPIHHSRTSQPFIHDLVTNLENRLNPDDDVDVLSAFAIVFDATSYPQLERELRDHGSQALAVLSDRFDTLLSVDELRTTFLQFKYTTHAHGLMSFSDTCTLVIKEYQRDFPAFATLANIASVIVVVTDLSAVFRVNVGSASRTVSKQKCGHI